jgi:hypothetical protein
MRILNVVELEDGIVNKITSFIIVNDENLHEVVKKAESLFEKCIKENYKFEDDEDKNEIIEFAIENGDFETYGGYNVCLIWSDL